MNSHPDTHHTNGLKMSLRQKTGMGIMGDTAEIPEPLNLYRSPSYLKRSKSYALPSITGVSVEGQNIRASGNMQSRKAAKSLPFNLARSNKTVKSVSTQTAPDKENTYKEKIKMLQEENTKLKAMLKEKEAAILNFRKIIDDKNAEYLKFMEEEKNCHKVTKNRFEESQHLVQEKIQLLDENTKHYEQVTQDLKTQYEEELAAVKKESQADIRQRDERIVKLKRQISDLFREKSWEHQHQLEELRKELNRLTDEAQLLRIKLKREEIHKRVCPNCNILAEKLEGQSAQLRLKDKAIKDLQSVCKKFEKQLLIHEQLLKSDLHKTATNTSP